MTQKTWNFRREKMTFFLKNSWKSRKKKVGGKHEKTAGIPFSFSCLLLLLLMLLLLLLMLLLMLLLLLPLLSESEGMALGGKSIFFPFPIQIERQQLPNQGPTHEQRKKN